MEINIFRSDYTEKKQYSYFYASDLHIGCAEFDEKRFTEDFTWAVEKNARIYAQEIFELIIPKDNKRYTAGKDKYQVDAHVNATIDEGIKLLTPFVDHIDIIGIGNHDIAILKYHGTDPIAFLIRDLNRLRNKKLPAIVHGGYSGFIRQKYHRNGGQVRFLDTYYNHGQGGVAEVSKGNIDLERRKNINTDIIWLQHKHKKIYSELDTGIGLSPQDNFYERPKQGIITGCYKTNYSFYDITKSNYRVDYGEERSRVTQARGGILLDVEISGDGIITYDMVIRNTKDTGKDITTKNVIEMS